MVIATRPWQLDQIAAHESSLMEVRFEGRRLKLDGEK
jgi:hypothetical protein